MEVNYMAKKYSSNDNRSNSMNPNNPAYQDSLDNRSNQLNPNNERYQEDKEEDEE